MESLETGQVTRASTSPRRASVDAGVEGGDGAGGVGGAGLAGGHPSRAAHRVEHRHGAGRGEALDLGAGRRRRQVGEAVPGEVGEERFEGREGGRARRSTERGSQPACRRVGAAAGSRRASSLIRISGPTPAGSPWVSARTGRRRPGRGHGLPASATATRAGGPPPAPLQLLFLEHVADVVLRDQQVRLVVAVELDRPLVVPLDPAEQLLAVVEHHHHRRLRRHLLEVVELLGVGLLGRRLLAADATAGEVALHVVHVGSDQLAVRHVHRQVRASAGGAGRDPGLRYWSSS